MKLTQLFSIYSSYLLGEDKTKEVRSICMDSRKVEPGSVFVAVRGTQSDGHEFISAAIKKGAIAIVCEKATSIPESYKGAVVLVPDARLAVTQLSSMFYGNPGNQLFCIGVTGTNGKTSITYMIEKILSDFGWPTGVMGTIDHHLGEQKWDSELTTPDPITLQRRLKEMVELGGQAVVFEVSSHAIAQKRAYGVPYDVSVFSNLTRDHLDYHLTMESYFECKEKLFDELMFFSSKKNKLAVVNTDDKYGKNINVAPTVLRHSYGQQVDCDYQILIERLSFSGTDYKIKTATGVESGFLPVVGLFSVYNATAAIAACRQAGVSLRSAMNSLATFKGVPGRVERVLNNKDLNIFVDYAHTDDALRSVILNMVKIREENKGQGQIIVVFGCGGDRDKGKRPLMMKAAQMADKVFVTSDNPRTEDPKLIIEDIIVDVDSDQINREVFIEEDRKTAIHRAIDIAGPEDVVIIAGKGHEDYQIIGKNKVHFCDVEVAQEYLKV